MSISIRLRILFVLLLSCLTASGFGADIPAFPEAKGFGAASVGGRGSSSGPYSFTVYEVTNTNDSGAGSFRAAVEASGPRFVIFKTGGTITLSSALTITNPYITIAGQTAPGGGIAVRGADFIVETHDVVIRYMSFRRGPGGDNHGIMVGDNGSTNVYNIIIDHCSISWATDECMGWQYQVHSSTAQNNLISEALHYSTHSGGAVNHGKGGMFAGRYGNNAYDMKGAYDISIHNNLFAHNHDRNPLFDLAGRGEDVNNVTYNAGNNPHIFYVRGAFTESAYNVIKNYVKKGPNSDPANYTIEPYYYGDGAISWGWYVEGNIDGYRTHDGLPEYYCFDPSLNSFPSPPRTYIAGARYAMSDFPISEKSAIDAYVDLISDGGAGNSRMLNADGTWSNRRDAVDQRIVYQIANGTGKWIDAPGASTCIDECRGSVYILSETDYTAAGVDLETYPLDADGWPDLAAGTGYTDTDHDGMPDAWETLYGVTDPMADEDNDGYTNLEEFLNGTTPLEGPPASIRMMSVGSGASVSIGAGAVLTFQE